MFWTVTQALLSGLATTFQIFILTLLFSLPLGLVIALASMSKFKPLRYLMQDHCVDCSRHTADAAVDHYFLWPRFMV